MWGKDKGENLRRKQITDERYNLMKKVKGDGMYEVINTYSYYGKDKNNNYTWLVNENDETVNYGKIYYNNDLALIGNTSQPFLRRGGGWGYGTDAGVFYSNGGVGYENYYVGFRPVLVVE